MPRGCRDIAVLHQSPREVRASQDVPAGDGLHLCQRDLHAVLAQIRRDARPALVAAALHPAAQRGKARIRRIKCVAEDVECVILLRAQLNARQHAHAKRLARAHCLGDAIHRVVVGQRPSLYTAPLDQHGKLGRAILPVRGGGMGVEVDDHFNPNASSSRSTMASGVS